MTVLTLFTVILGTVEFSRIYSIYQNLTDAAREGARYAVAPDASTQALPSVSAVQGHVAPFLSSLNISGATVNVTTTTRTVNGVANTYSHVTVSAPYSFLFFPFSSVTISANSEMRNETN